MKTSIFHKVALVALFRHGQHPSSLLAFGSFLLAILGLLNSSIALGQVYYVSPNGSDSNTGLGSGSGQAWETIEKVNLEMAAGKTFLFERGAKFRGTIDISGINGAEIILGAFGSGDAPIISGSHEVPDLEWEVHSGNIWKAVVPVAAASDVFMVFRNGNRQVLARYPDSGWLRTDATTGYILEDAALTEGTDHWKDAKAIVRNSNWSYKTYLVLSSVVGELELDDGFSTQMEVGGWGYFLAGKLNMVSTEGEWYYEHDGTVGTLYLHAGTGGPPTGVEYSVRDVVDILNQGVRINESSNVTVEELDFIHQTKSGASIYNSNQVEVLQCGFRDMYDGIGADLGSDHTYKNCTLQRILNNGIRAAAGGICLIEGNTLQDIGLWPGEGADGWGYIGIWSAKDDAVVRENSLSDIGYAAIAAEGEGVIVEKNYVTRALALLNDGPGITIDDCADMVVRYNIVAGLDEVVEQRLESVSPDYVHNEDISFGIYFGNREITGAVVEHNVVTGCSGGIHVDHTLANNDNKVRNNTLFANAVQLSLSDYSNCTYPEGNGNCNGGFGVGGDNYLDSYNTEYTGNIMYCLSSDQVVMQQNNSWAGSYVDAVDFGSFSGNYYFNPFSDVAIHRRFHYAVADVTQYLRAPLVPMSFEYWQSLGEDIGSKRSPLRLNDFDVMSTSGVIAELSDDLESGVGDWIASNAECDKDELDLSLEGGTGNALRNTDCIWIEHEGYNAFAIADNPVGPGEIASGSYRYTFRLRSADTDAVQFCPQYAAGTYRGPRFVALTSEWRDHELVIDVVDEHGDDYLYTAFQNVWYGLGAQSSSVIDIDNIVAEACSLNASYPAQIAADHILHYHNPLADEPYEPHELVGCWADVYNNVYTGEVSVAPWESIVLYRLDVDDANLALDINDEYHITGTELWNTHRNVEGRVVVEDGGTLIVDNAIIGFAESTGGLTTNIVVEPGGTLIVRNNGHLTSLVDCDDPVMWDGVKVLGNGSDSGAGEAYFQSGAKVSNALTAVRCAEGSPIDPLTGNISTGGIVIGEDAIFENNRFDIVTRPHTSASSSWGTSQFTNCRFRHTRALNDPSQMGWVNVSLSGSVGMQFTSCIFENLSGLRSTSGALLGIGISTLNTRILVKDDVTGNHRGRFEGLGTGILHSPFTPTNNAMIEGCDFIGNARGALITGSNNGSMNRCTFLVPDEDVSELNVPAAYGSYFYGCTGFEFEENSFSGATSTTHAKVGAVFRSTGTADNVFYNNTFDRFNDQGEQSCGTIVMGSNAHSSTGVGLRIKCNDYSQVNTNDFDVAFTGSSVTIADEQGGLGVDTQDPAGNTFAGVNPITCGGNAAQHIFVENTVNTFEYYHHDPSTTPARVEPDCADSPINPATWYTNTSWDYDKPESCPFAFSEELLFMQLDQAAREAHSTYDQSHSAYTAWKDNGDTEGLLAYVRNGSNGSTAVRNRLIQLAPTVGAEVWNEALARIPELNPWHLAQALLANSPLEPKVLALMEQHGLAPFYQQLILDGQNGGVSMHSISRSEIAMAHATRSVALNDIVRKAVRSGDSTDLALARQAVATYGGGTMARQQLVLFYAQGDLGAARVLITAQLEADDEDRHYWQVQALALDMFESGTPFTDLAASGQQVLRDIVASDDPSSAEAAAWLAMLGQDFTEVLILPSRGKRYADPEEDENKGVDEHPRLAAYPNPSNGPVYLTYQVPEGVGQVEIRVHDAQGALVFTQRMAPDNGIVEVLPNNLATGLHVVSLHYDGVHVGTTKVNLVKRK